MLFRASISLLLPLLVTPAALTQSTPAAAATNLISVRLLDADSGDSVPNLRVDLYGDTGGKPLPVTTLADLYEIDIRGQISIKFGAIVSLASADIDFTPCIPQGTPPFDIKQIQTTGIAPQNRCTRKNHPAAPGELVVFIRRTHWWERWRTEE